MGSNSLRQNTDIEFSRKSQEAKAQTDSYGKKASEKVMQDMLGKMLSFDDFYAEMSGKSKSNVVNMIWEGLNFSDLLTEKRTKLAETVADYILDNAVYKAVFETTKSYANEETYKLLKSWHHKINLDSIKDKIKYRKEKDNGAFVYSFSAEKNSEFITRQTLHADDINEKIIDNNELTTNSIPENSENVNTSGKKTLGSNSLIKNTDIEFSRKSPGQQAKETAKGNNLKVYSKKESTEMVGKVSRRYENQLSGKAKQLNEKFRLESTVLKKLEYFNSRDNTHRMFNATRYKSEIFKAALKSSER